MRDKVYGFEFHNNRMPLFSKPGDGFKVAFANAIVAAHLNERSGVLDINVDRLFILDVIDFGNRSQFKHLKQTLM